MNTVIKIMKSAIKLLIFWIWDLPVKVGLWGVFFYFGLMFLLVGSADMSEIKYKILEGQHFAQFLLFLFCGVPGFVSFFVFLSWFDMKPNPDSSLDSHLDSVISHRDNMMRNSTPQEAYNIMKNTSNLDMMKNNSAFTNAKIGFNAVEGRNTPSRVFNGLMGRKK